MRPQRIKPPATGSRAMCLASECAIEHVKHQTNTTGTDLYNIPESATQELVRIVSLRY
jgi:hypothetical protein